MAAYVARRLLQAIVTLVIVSLVVFAIMRATPGDPAQAMVGNVSGVTPELLSTIRHEMGLDRPLHIQYLTWLADLVRGDFGHSYISQASVGKLLARRLPASLELALAATLLALAISIPAGILSALRRGSWLDHLTTTFVTAGIAMPGFWLAMLIVLVFAVRLKLLPPSGYVSFGEDPRENLRLLILPASTLTILVAAPTMRFLRSSMLNVLGEDYVRTARAKGLRERAVVMRHAFRNAAIPLVTLMALDLPYIFSGALFTEVIFAWPGMGRLFFTAAERRDYPLLMAIVMITATLIVLSNLLADVLYAVLDPRIRYA